MKSKGMLFKSEMVQAILDGTKTQTRRTASLGLVAGDKIWVRETWRVGSWKHETRSIALDFFDGPQKKWIRVPAQEKNKDGFDVFERLANDSLEQSWETLGIQLAGYKWNAGQGPCKWRPSLFMPKWASRITLKLIDVKQQWLRDMTEADAVAEGFKSLGRFVGYWDAIHSKHFDRQWVSNPTVFVYTFERQETA